MNEDLSLGFVNNLLGGRGASLSSLRHEDKLEILCDLPGVKKEDVEIKYENEMLMIKATRKRPDNLSQYSEGKFGELVRYIDFPSNKFDTKKIEASMEDGVLTIVIMRKKELLPNVIKIK